MQIIIGDSGFLGTGYGGHTILTRPDRQFLWTSPHNNKGRPALCGLSCRPRTAPDLQGKGAGCPQSDESHLSPESGDQRAGRDLVEHSQ
ncbi:MAG: hypothetical protein L6W00_10910 [Lentisphaeria bacterium]|nr:MAG: hypothetical protein L6W00_10910 [Lentisphaeria bacterium]